MAVIKHCAHGFDLGGEEKDSSQFSRRRARTAWASCPRDVGRDQKEAEWSRVLTALARMAVSGHRTSSSSRADAKRSRPEENRSRAAGGCPEASRLRNASLPPWWPISSPPAGVPVFHPDEVGADRRLAGGRSAMKSRGSFLKCDGKAMPMNPFVRKCLTETRSRGWSDP